MGNYQDKIAARKRNLFEQKRQVNQLYAQRLAEGMTPAQAATTPYRRVEPPPRYEPYTIKDGDTLETIAQQNNITPQQVVQYNPLMQTPQTGMVIETRPPQNNYIGSARWQQQMNPWGSYTPTWLERVIGLNLPPQGNPNPIYSGNPVDDFLTATGLYGPSGWQWWERPYD